VRDFRADFEAISANVGLFIQGKKEAVDLALVCMLAEGHLLVEDVPGVGKTSLARSIAASLGMSWHRIQFTPDLLPSDITGVSVFHQGAGAFEFHPGPVFAHIVLADEINRAAPRTQSAMLEVMEERTVTVDGVSHVVLSPFIVLATPLPEAQLDRFLMMISLGYPDHRAEAKVLANVQDGVRLEELTAVSDARTVTGMIATARSIHAAPDVRDYIVSLVAQTRSHPDVRLGASPRGSVGLLRAAQVVAAANGRDYVTPSDVQVLAVPVLAHRLLMKDGDVGRVAARTAIKQIIERLPVPQG
jgi:MoxR-like ATPase